MKINGLKPKPRQNQTAEVKAAENPRSKRVKTKKIEREREKEKVWKHGPWVGLLEENGVKTNPRFFQSALCDWKVWKRRLLLGFGRELTQPEKKKLQKNAIFWDIYTPPTAVANYYCKRERTLNWRTIMNVSLYSLERETAHPSLKIKLLQEEAQKWNCRLCRRFQSGVSNVDFLFSIFINKFYITPLLLLIYSLYPLFPSNWFSIHHYTLIHNLGKCHVLFLANSLYISIAWYN